MNVFNNTFSLIRDKNASKDFATADFATLTSGVVINLFIQEKTIL